MSGMNPFRRRKAADPAGQPSFSTVSTNPSSSEYPVAAPVTNISTLNGLQGPHPANDDYGFAEGLSADPFNAATDSSDLDAGDKNVFPATPFPNSPISTSFVPIAPRRDREPPPVHESRKADIPVPATTAAKSDVLVHSLPSSHPESYTASSSSTDVSEESNRINTERAATERGMSEMDKYPALGGLASRGGGRQEKPPPPPPRSHHGKLISTNSAPASYRLSLYGSSTEATSTSRPDALSRPSNGSGLGISDENQPLRQTVSLQRSQSQLKRSPPTPPLSRRQSQMRRSKTTHSKTNPTRYAVAQRDIEASAPLSTDRKSISSSIQESGSSSPVSDDAASRAPSSYEEPINIGAPTTENLTSAQLPRIPTTRAAKRVSYTNSLAMNTPPPPPPPRRRGASSNSNDSKRVSWAQESTAKEEEEFTPHPSNANGILADLSRLQKEVDDLRGHYEGRKASQ